MDTKIASLSLIILFTIILTFSGCTENPENNFIKAVYDNEPRLENGHIDVPALISSIKAHNANTYNYLIWHSEHDWEDLLGFLEEAQKEGIDVWITISPPQERLSEPFGIDYEQWAEEIALLSLKYPCIKAWSIDNIMYLQGKDAVAYLESFTGIAKDINPSIKFIPVVYIYDLQSENFNKFAEHFDGIQFYYKNFPNKEGFGGYQEAESQIAYAGSVFSKKIIFGIYASPWQPQYPTTSGYVKELIKIAKKKSDGVMIYAMQPEGEKLDAIREGFK